MSHNASILLSMGFLILVMLMMSDLFVSQAIYYTLDSMAVTASYRISMDGGITSDLIDLVQRETGGTISYVDPHPSLSFGSVVSFRIQREYTPFVMSEDEMTITVRRTAVIGYIAG